jgi:hypothetical protein
MRPGTVSTKAAVILGATALATGVMPPAQAHEDLPYVSPYQATALDMRGLVDAGTYHAILDRKLDVVQATVNALQANVAAIPSTTILTGAARDAAKARLMKVTFVQRLLAAIPTTGPYAATAGERAQVEAIAADLAAIRNDLATLLANEPVAPTTLRPARRTMSLVKADRDGSRVRWSNWSNWPTWSGWTWDRDGDHHCHH